MLSLLFNMFLLKKLYKYIGYIVILLFPIFILSNCKTIEINDDKLHLVNIDSLSIVFLESFPLQAMVILKGELPNPCCVFIDEYTTNIREGNRFTLEVYYEDISKRHGGNCAQVTSPFSKSIPLEIYNLKAGKYTVNVNGKIVEFELDIDNTPNGNQN